MTSASAAQMHRLCPGTLFQLVGIVCSLAAGGREGCVATTLYVGSCTMSPQLGGWAWEGVTCLSHRESALQSSSEPCGSRRF